MAKRKMSHVLLVVALVGVVIGYWLAQQKMVADSGASPVKALADREVYYPGSEDLKPDEMRVVACGTGMPNARPKQAAACFLVELGNGDKFIFDMDNGSFERIHALGISLDYLDKVFITHPHMDHMADLATFYMTGPQNNRSVPLRVWGPGGGGMRPEWSVKTAMEIGRAHV